MTTNDVNFQMIVQGEDTFRDLHSDYGQKELYKGYNQMRLTHGRKRGADAKEEFADLLEELQKGGKTWFNERIDWLLNGSYGSEVHYYLMNVIENAFSGKTGKRFKNALTMCAKICIQTLCLLEHPSLNIHAVFQIFKKLPEETNNAIINAAKEEIISYFTTE